MRYDFLKVSYHEDPGKYQYDTNFWWGNFPNFIRNLNYIFKIFVLDRNHTNYNLYFLFQVAEILSDEDRTLTVMFRICINNLNIPLHCVFSFRFGHPFPLNTEYSHYFELMCTHLFLHVYNNLFSMLVRG